jgi:monolysocardiolipin acyltransferase
VQALVLGSVGAASKLFLAGASQTTVQGAEVMQAALERPRGQPLITVSNHVASLDDPLVTAALVPPRYLLRPDTLRWTLCASDRCFRHALLAPFFRAAKVLPVDRGAGVAQTGMRAAAERLRAGDWVHIFPEGTRGAGAGARMLPARRGVGWLVAACEQPPLVVPFVHTGMEGVVPRGSALPRPGREVRVLVGDPIPVHDLLAAAREQGWSERALECAVADRVGATLYALRAQLEGVAVEAVAPEQAAAAVALQEEALLPLIEEEMARARGWRTRWEALRLPSLAQRAQRHCHSPGQQGELRRRPDEAPAAPAVATPTSSAPRAAASDALRMLRGRVLAARAQLQRVVSSAGAHDMGLPRSSSAQPLLADGHALLSSIAAYSAGRAQHMRELLQRCGGVELSSGEMPALVRLSA